MSTLGIAIAPTGHKGRPELTAVLLGGTRAAPVVEDTFVVRTAADDEAEQVVDIAAGLESKVTGMSFAKAVVRIAGQSGVASRRGAGPHRARLEGAAVYVLRRRLTVPVVLADGTYVATAVDAADTAAGTAIGKALVRSAPEAAAAALSGLS